MQIPLNFLSVLSASSVPLQPSSEPIHYNKRNTIEVPRLVVLIKYFMVCCQGICKLLRLRELIRLTMHLGSAVLADRLARITNRTIGVFRKMGERVMLTLRGIKTKLATPAASALKGVLGPAGGPT